MIELKLGASYEIFYKWVKNRSTGVEDGLKLVVLQNIEYEDLRHFNLYLSPKDQKELYEILKRRFK